MTKKIHIYSRGRFALLDDEFLANKAIIRIHNKKDLGWYDDKMANGIVLFFDDLKINDIPWKTRLKACYINADYDCFSKKDAQVLLKFIHANLEKDFVIHCEYGKSRSVAVAFFMKQEYNFKIMNKNKEEMLKGNDWMLKLLKKYA